MTTIGIIAASCQPEPERLRAGIAVLEEQGFRVKAGERNFEQRPHTPEEDALRALELERMFLDPEVDAVLCARGGYGVARLLDYVDWDKLAGVEKPFCGYSDITTLHGILARYVPRLRRAYGPMAACRMVEHRSPRAQQLYSFLRGEGLGNVLEDAADEMRVIHGGAAEGPVTGGCLCLVASTLGTPYELDTVGKILILEDINEESRRVDRYLTHLKHAGKLDGVVGVIAGQTFCLPDEKDPMGTQDEILLRYLEPLNVPLILDAPIGHVDELLTVPVDTPAVLDADAAGGPSLVVQSG